MEFTLELRLESLSVLLALDIKNSLEANHYEYVSNSSLIFSHNDIRYEIEPIFKTDTCSDQYIIDIFINMIVERDVIHYETINSEPIYLENVVHIKQLAKEWAPVIIEKMMKYIDKIINRKLCVICFKDKEFEDYCSSCYFARSINKGDELCPICLMNISFLSNTMACCKKQVHIECINRMKINRCYKCPRCNKEDGIRVILYSPLLKQFT